MFTGLVEAIGQIARAGSREGVRELVIRSPFAPGELPAGASVAIQGVCLTLLEDSGRDGSFRVQAAAETLRRTTLGRLRPADRVHLERAVRPVDRMGGHFVQGHVDGIGVLRRVARRRGDRVLEVAAPPSIRRYIVEKGSICVDGVSLTVGAVGARWFRVHVIPATVERTLLGTYRPGRAVNIEVDVLAKYVEALLADGSAPRSGRPKRETGMGEDE